ncbi:L,D-transpeptidase, partial [Solemya velum gill symbiont]
MDEIVETYSVSTALNGPGEQQGSECTPRGMHSVRLKIGDGCSLNSVFVGRRHTGEIYTPVLGEDDPQ